MLYTVDRFQKRLRNNKDFLIWVEETLSYYELFFSQVNRIINSFVDIGSHFSQVCETKCRL